MAGVVAMASAIEDFDTQPCKKSRKDGGSPVVKTITNYFSPVTKPVEKPFSPPRSNNIMDYFSRKVPSSKEKTSPSQQSKENCQTPQSTEKCTSPEAAVRQPSQKRSRKATKTARKLVESEHACFTATDSCLILDGSHQTKDMATEVISGCGVLGSDTAALLAELSAEASATTWTSEKTAAMAVVIDLTEKDEQHKQSCHSDKPKAELRCISSSSNVPLREKTKLVKTATWSSKNKLQENMKQPEPEEKEAETTFCDVSMEDTEDKASEANNSTVTISFEDFLRSQGQDESEEDKEEGGKITMEAKEMDNDLLTNVSSGEPLLQVSPRIVTIQAEIHTVSPKQETVKGVGKLASIFIKRKGAASVNVVPSPQTEVGHQSSSSLRSIKRKSNVVLQEEDLELAVLESETTPKCSEAERKQFMAAFKQPNQDGSKTKPGKSQIKQKNLDPAENVAEEDGVIPPAVEQVPAASQESIVAKKKLRTGKKKAQEENETVGTSLVAASPAAKEIGVPVIDVGDEQEEPTIPAVRRSRRGAVVKQAPDTTTATPVRKNRKQKESMDDGDAAALPDCSENMSTPKTRRSKHGVFVAELVGPPDVNESPIRIKFTRVHRNVSTSKAGSESGINTSKATKTSDNESKKRKQAKKLVEKAKVIQQSKKTSAEKRSPLRRSSRYEASLKKSYCENEDSIICLEDDQSASSSLKVLENRKTQKPLRSLNDVLGKATSTVKETRAVPGSKAAMLGPEKSASKVSTVISIFDDSSREGSENSQDDEQFKARREFLKSGLPDSFRKQIAKNTATKEAYSLSCSSFQPVIHIKQSTNDCPLWTLSWPESSLLCPLKELWSPSSSFSFVSGSFDLKTEPAPRAFCERGSGWRPEISDSVRELLIEEVSNSNPPFPAQMFITRFLKRRTDHQQHSCTASETTSLSGGKRKRMDDGGENAAKVSKRQRGNHSDKNVPKSEPRKRGGQAKRVGRFTTEKEAKDKVEPFDVSAFIPCEDESVVVLDDLLPVKDTVEKDVMKEDMLWTEKYQPQHSSDIVGNSSSVRRLHSWLKEWKLRADQEERKKQKDKKQEEGNNDSDWDCGEEDSQDTEDLLCNTMLITGPTGVGKTAAIYACAQELGFKVFEVNASSQRSGRLILSQLREATQSHQVDSQGINAHKPTYFNSYSSSSSASTTRPGFSPRKVNSPRRVVSSPRKHPQSPRGAKKGALAPTSLVNFFKTSQPTVKDPHYTKKNEQAATSKKANNESANKQKDVTVKSASTASTPKENSEEQSKKTATSLILFEEVDVIFDEDSGFLAAVKTFMTTTKRPVILTTSDPAFSTMFDGNFEEIHFKTPSVLNVGTYLQLLCLAEDMRTDPANISSLLRLNGCDIRQSLLQLQFWTRSAGGCYVTRPLKHPDTSELKPEPDKEAGEMSECQVTVPHALPPCDTGCTESRLGLLNLEPERDIWKLFRSQSLKEAVCWELLINSRRRGVDLLYTNMETLLPLPLTQLNSFTVKPVSESKDHPSDFTKVQPSLDMLPSHTRLLHVAESGDCSDDSSPVKVSNRMRKNKRRHCLPVRDGLHSDSDSEEGFLSLCKPQGFAQDKERVSERVVPEKVKRKPLTAEERVKSLPVSQCLESIADFFDNMSYLDSSLLMYPEGGGVHRRTPAVSAVFKDGMTDESRVEADSRSWVSREQVLQIQAAVEALSFHKCRSSVTSAWDKSQQLEGELGKEAAEELTLPVASHRNGHTLSQDGPCQLQLVQRRREVVESLILRGVVGLGNRPSAALDYLAILRTICRSERLKEKGKVKRRFLHYLDAIHLGLEKSTIQHLAEDFP